ncbi:hypothetical protein GOBAR_DD33853 [Gossypium barbadense]|nr:hypothetical protein GOBAR_DD33853 [Gossypium barbadense]
MGLTLELKDLLNLFTQRPLSYTIMPTFAMIISKTLGLSPSLSVGLILLGCCPGGAASTVVTFIARGDVSLSTVMTVCTTLGAVILTPLLTMVLAGTYVSIDAIGLSISTLQVSPILCFASCDLRLGDVVVAPVLLGSYLQSTFPLVVKMITPFAPLFAVLLSSLLACSLTPPIIIIWRRRCRNTFRDVATFYL